MGTQRQRSARLAAEPGSDIEEHVALARWGNTALVNTHGEIFNAASEDQLPIFEGPAESSRDLMRQYATFNRNSAALATKHRQIKLSPRHAWRVHLDNGTILELGREQMKTRLERYVLMHDISSCTIEPAIELCGLTLSQRIRCTRDGAVQCEVRSKGRNKSCKEC